MGQGTKGQKKGVGNAQDTCEMRMKHYLIEGVRAEIRQKLQEDMHQRLWGNRKSNTLFTLISYRQ
jgi:hypothetical protein